jgi:hypothetical protein
MKILIEKGLPIPDDVRLGNYPLAEMKVGDSFALVRKRRAGVSSAVTKYQKTSGLKSRFTVRAVVENGIDMVRVWRIE